MKSQEQPDQSPTERWPELSRLAALESTRQGLRRLLVGGGWVYIPAFLDSGERALRTLQGVAKSSSQIGQSIQVLTSHLARQTKPRLCLEGIAELACASWLAERGALVPDDGGAPAASSVIDLRANVGDIDFGLEVKSDFDAFESEFMDGSSPGDPAALRPKLQERFGAKVRAQMRWLGERPPREDWGPNWTKLRRELAASISDAPAEIPIGGNCVFTAALDRPLRRWRGVEVLVSNGPLVGIEIRIGNNGWDELYRRILSHAAAKASKTDASFVLVYVSQPPQKATTDSGRLYEVAGRLRDSADLPQLLGVFHLRLTPAENSAGEATGFSRDHWAGGAEVMASLGVGQLQPTPARRLSGSTSIV